MFHENKNRHVHNWEISIPSLLTIIVWVAAIITQDYYLPYILFILSFTFILPAINQALTKTHNYIITYVYHTALASINMLLLYTHNKTIVTIIGILSLVLPTVWRFMSYKYNRHIYIQKLIKMDQKNS